MRLGPEPTPQLSTYSSILAVARPIHDLAVVVYPEGIEKPRIELNVNMGGGRFRYDRAFLLQFMNVCIMKPNMLTHLDALGLEPGQTPMSPSAGRGGSGRHRPGLGLPTTHQTTMAPRFEPSAGFGQAASTNPSSSSPAIPPGLSSEERFNMSNRSVIFSDSSLEPASTKQTTDPIVPKVPGKRTRSKRGEKKAGKSVESQLIAPMAKPVQPLQVTLNRWDKTAVQNVDMGVRMVTSLLNKLAPDNFDSISDQIILWINKQEQGSSPIPLQQATRLIFEHSITGELLTPVFARLCKKMVGGISPSVQDGGFLNSECKPVAGGQLFRKYLLGRCQEESEQWWTIKLAPITSEATKAAVVVDGKGKGKELGHQFDFVAYDAAQKAKQQSLGLIKFTGELFKHQMLTERIMHEHIKKLLEEIERHKGEKEVEGLRKLLVTIGALLDVPKARARMDVYFQRLVELAGNRNLSSRTHFMLQDLIELRERKWVTRRPIMVPMTIAQLREVVAWEREAQEEASRLLLMCMPRRGWKRGNVQNGPSPQATPDSGSGTRKQPPKAGDLLNPGKIRPLPAKSDPISIFKQNGKPQAWSIITNKF